ncbi:hypothetical protein [Photobacterium angustum]|nr:hypothetical protein [Photobacterium angustum]
MARSSLVFMPFNIVLFDVSTVIFSSTFVLAESSPLPERSQPEIELKEKK